jgi:uncharacterized protein YjbJ (UPF0337 family)
MVGTSPTMTENTQPRGTFLAPGCSLGIAAAAAHVRARKRPMGSTADKIKGMANEAAGNIKQAAGKALNKPGLEAEGFAQERKGEAQQAVGKAKDAVKKVIDKA